MPVGGDPKSVGFARVPGVFVDFHDAGAIVQDKVNGVLAVVGVEGECEVAGGVEAVEVGDGR